jgi:hypothetical protein
MNLGSRSSDRLVHATGLCTQNRKSHTLQHEAYQHNAIIYMHVKHGSAVFGFPVSFDHNFIALQGFWKLPCVL